MSPTGREMEQRRIAFEKIYIDALTRGVAHFKQMGQHATTIIMDEWGYIRPRTFFAERSQLNYSFGEALQDLKHPFAAEYHKLGQAGKEKQRHARQRKAESPAAAMAKYRPVWSKYLELRQLAELTDKLENS